MRLWPLVLVLSVACDGSEPANCKNLSGVGLEELDCDNDEFTQFVDCDDTDPEVNPRADEVTWDGVDNDCDPETADEAADCDHVDAVGAEELDCDDDGHKRDVDCDDADPAVNPAQSEVAWDGIDNDCDPATLDDDLDQDGEGVADDCDDGDPALGGDAAPRCWSLGAEDSLLRGGERWGDFGSSVVFLPDVDGDGVGDLGVGAPGYDGDLGRLYVFDGAAVVQGGLDWSTEQAMSGLDGLLAYDRIGSADRVMALPDGERIAIGVPTWDPGGFTNGGVVFLVGAVGLAGGGDVASAAEVVFQGRANGDRFGETMSAGDVDGDGVADLIISSPQDDTAAANAGQVAVFFGANIVPGTRSVEDADIALYGAFNERLGQGALAAVGDIDGDGGVDLAVGSSTSDGAGRNEPGVVYLLHADGLEDGNIEELAFATLVGDNSSDLFGLSLVTPGDWDGDGTNELVVGALRGEIDVTNEGTVGLWWGGSDLTGQLDAATADLIWGGGAGLSRIGASLQTGDIDGDEIVDLAFGAPYRTGSSRAYLLAGADASTWTGDVDADAAGWITGAPPSTALDTFAIGSLGGTRVIAAGTPTASPGSVTEAGALYLFTGW
jgi:hypothetical protein